MKLQLRLTAILFVICALSLCASGDSFANSPQKAAGHPPQSAAQESAKLTQPNSQPAAEARATRTESDPVAAPAKTSPAAPPVLKKRKEFSEAIEDNSFLVEEAYNQERGVVQHIFGGVYFSSPQHDFVSSFTQEWPAPSEKHQLSYTIPYSFLDSNAVHGAGDVMLNYRYQLFDKQNWAAVSPRITLIIPTGKVSKGLGSGSTGVQLNLPVSKRLSNAFVAHFNSGMTYFPAAKTIDPAGLTVKHALTSYNLGGSLIWLTQKNFNVMLEHVINFNNVFDDHARTSRFTEYIVSPGVRFAINKGGLQIVPGVAVPVSMSSAGTRTGGFFYLSFEHPFKKAAAEGQNRD